jgi:hypothetical protein
MRGDSFTHLLIFHKDKSSASRVSNVEFDQSKFLSLS